MRRCGRRTVDPADAALRRLQAHPFDRVRNIPLQPTTRVGECAGQEVQLLVHGGWTDTLGAPLVDIRLDVRRTEIVERLPLKEWRQPLRRVQVTLMSPLVRRRTLQVAEHQVVVQAGRFLVPHGLTVGLQLPLGQQRLRFLAVYSPSRAFNSLAARVGEVGVPVPAVRFFKEPLGLLRHARSPRVGASAPCSTSPLSAAVRPIAT